YGVGIVPFPVWRRNLRQVVEVEQQQKERLNRHADARAAPPVPQERTPDSKREQVEDDSADQQRDQGLPFVLNVSGRRRIVQRGLTLLDAAHADAGDAEIERRPDEKLPADTAPEAAPAREQAADP